MLNSKFSKKKKNNPLSNSSTETNLKRLDVKSLKDRVRIATARAVAPFSILCQCLKTQ